MPDREKERVPEDQSDVVKNIFPSGSSWPSLEHRRSEAEREGE